MTKVLLCGANGKMGHVISECIQERNDMRIVSGVDINTTKYSDFNIYKSFDEVIEKIDVIIDFSNPILLSGILDFAKENSVPVVLATTGYTKEQVEIINKASNEIPVFFTFNMSLGINLLTELAKKAALILGDQFDIEIIEKHHNQKIDAPSGTAIMLANAINDVRNKKYIYEYDRHSKRQKRESNEIGIHSVRGGTIVGEHEVIFAGRDEVISLSHHAASKEVFAVGAVNAAAFLKSKNHGLYTMNDLINEQ